MKKDQVRSADQTNKNNVLPLCAPFAVTPSNTQPTPRNLPNTVCCGFPFLSSCCRRCRCRHRRRRLPQRQRTTAGTPHRCGHRCHPHTGAETETETETAEAKTAETQTAETGTVAAAEATAEHTHALPEAFDNHTHTQQPINQIINFSVRLSSSAHDSVLRGAAWRSVVQRGSAWQPWSRPLP